MRRLVLGISIGFLSAASLAWAFTVQFPNTLKIKGSATVDELGNVLGGGTPVRVEIVEGGAPEAQVVVDSNGVVIGTVSRPIAPGGAAYILRSIAGVEVEFQAKHFGLEGSIGGGIILVFESPDCSGQAFASIGDGPFYPASHVPDGTTLYFALGPKEAIAFESKRTVDPSGVGTCVPDSSATNLYPIGTLDLTQFVPPFTVEVG